MPLRVDDRTQIAKIADLLPELKDYYGENLAVSLDLNFNHLGDKPINLSSQEGILIGAN